MTYTVLASWFNDCGRDNLLHMRLGYHGDTTLVASCKSPHVLHSGL